MRKLRIISLILVLVLAASLFAGCGGKDKKAAKKDLTGEVTWIVIGTEAADNLDVFAEFNEKLKAKGKYIIPGRVPRKLFMEQLY